MHFCPLLLSFLLFYSSLSCCTGIRMSAQDGSSVNGRTVEFGVMIDMYACVIPRAYSFSGKTPLGKGLDYKAKYAAVGIFCFQDPVLMDGINEKGLSCGAFYFPGFAEYSQIDKGNQKRALSPVDFPNWILTQFSSLSEVENALDSIVIAPTVIEGWGPTPPPFHYIVYDRLGNSLVIEPIQGKLMSYKNKIGAFTNSPTFDWHMINLRNFINLSPFNVDPVTLRGEKFASFGQGSGMVGLPGDFTPPSRFIRAAIFSSTALPVKAPSELVLQTFHILNQFDIPFGLIRQKEKNSLSVDYTLLTSVKNPNSLEYFFKSYEDQTVKCISLKEFDFNAKKIKSISTKGRGSDVNISASLQ